MSLDWLRDPLTFLPCGTCEVSGEMFCSVEVSSMYQFFTDVIRSLGLRLKSVTANGQNVGAQASKEGRSEIDEEYKIFTSIRSSERNNK